MIEKEDKRVPPLIGSTTKRLLAAVRMLLWLCVVIIVLVGGSLARSFVVQGQVNSVDDSIVELKAATEQTERVAEAAQVSADAALAELRAAIRAVQESNSGEPDLQNQAIINALQAIARIEAFICNGPCPNPE